MSAILHARGVDDDFKLRPDYGNKKTNTFLCQDCCPPELELAHLPGSRVARIIGTELLFGEVVEIAGIRADTRRAGDRVLQLIAKPADEWRYSVERMGRQAHLSNCSRMTRWSTRAISRRPSPSTSGSR